MLTLTNKSRDHSPRTFQALQASEAFVFLGLYPDALEELEAIEMCDREMCDVMVAWSRTLLHLGRFEEAAALSAKGEIIHPNEDEFTVQRAFALHHMNKSEEAAKVILAAPDWLKRTGILHYNLACYEARWGNLQLAKQCVQAAITINAAIKKSARKDPDLAELWN